MLTLKLVSKLDVWDNDDWREELLEMAGGAWKRLGRVFERSNKEKEELTGKYWFTMASDYADYTRYAELCGFDPLS